MFPPLDESEAFAALREVVDDLRAILWQVDCRKNEFTWISRHAEEVLGYPLEHWKLPCFWETHIHPDDREPVKATCARVLASGEDHQLEYRMIAADGRTVWLRQIVRVVKDKRGVPLALRGVMVDTTERRVAEDALRESDQRFRELAEHIREVFWIRDSRTNRILYVSPAYEELWGLSCQSLYQNPTSFLDALLPEDRDRFLAESRRAVENGAPFQVEYRIVSRGGQVRWILSRAFPVLDDNGDLCRYVGLAKDVTDRRKADQLLRDLSKRMTRLRDEERRRIARELHDSSGQNLAALRLNLARLIPFSQKPEADRLVAECLALADATLEEIRTVSHLLHPPLLDELGLESALRSFTRGFSDRSGIAVDLEIAQDLGDLAPELETALFRIVQEGLNNTHRHARAAQCWITLRRGAGELLLELRDNGIGIVARQASDNGADGVGLSGMRDRVRELGGSLTIESDGGCVVRAAFPAAR